jgi:hypothetical protein
MTDTHPENGVEHGMGERWVHPHIGVSGAFFWPQHDWISIEHLDRHIHSPTRFLYRLLDHLPCLPLYCLPASNRTASNPASQMLVNYLPSKNKRKTAKEKNTLDPLISEKLRSPATHQPQILGSSTLYNGARVVCIESAWVRYSGSVRSCMLIDCVRASYHWIMDPWR